MHPSIQDVIDNRLLQCLFQPIIDVNNRAVLGYEALSRGPSDSPLHSPAALFAAAYKASRCSELDRLCLHTAASRRHELGMSGRLFVNLTPPGLLSLGRDIEQLERIIDTAKIGPEQLVLELTEQSILEDYQVIRDAMRRIRALGVAFAIDDLGAGYSGLRAWSELNPEFVKIDRYFISGVDSDPLKMEFVRAIVDMARAARSKVIAEGVETAAEAAELVEAGIRFLQGFYMARPTIEPATALSETAVQRCPIDDLKNLGENKTARHLVCEQVRIPPDMKVEKVAELFHQRVDLEALPVIQNNRPLGIVKRSSFLDTLSIPLRRELYSRKPIRALMDERAVIVDADLRLDQVSRILTSRNRESLHEQFIVTERDEYLGMARMVDLLRVITQEQLQIARYSNPLTSLPGNLPIYDWINCTIARRRQFVVCHLDIDNFKPFNDFYGYAKGDEALLTVADILKRNVSPRIDFVGHVGGDDFVLVFRSPDWEQRVARCFTELDHARADLYKPAHLEEGGIVTRDRYGEERIFPLLSISVAALVCDAVPDCSAEELVYHIAPIKALAKREAGNVLKTERYSRLLEEPQAAKKTAPPSGGAVVSL